MPLEEMGLRGREWMSAEFSWDAAAREVCNTYSMMLIGAPAIGDTAALRPTSITSAEKPPRID